MTGGREAIAPVLVLALDGATFDVIDPLIASGRLPNLAAWKRDGAAHALRSTVPAASFPAWSTFMTGLWPGRHGLFDFTQKIPGAYRLRFANATDRRGESIFARVSRRGGTCLVLGMPATYPPEPVQGLIVPGFDAPVSSSSDAGGTSDPALYRRIAARAGPWMRPALREDTSDDASRERALATLLDRVARKESFALAALDITRGDRGSRPDLMVVVFSESDTVAHHYWRDHDADSPRHEPTASRERRGAVTAVYERLDAACGALRAAFGEDALCVVVSDHGSGGAARRVVHLNRWLETSGFLVRKRTAALDGLARRARDLALALLPPRVAEQVFRRSRAAAARVESAARFGGIDWRRSAAFSEEANTQPGIWINLAGREAQGAVAPPDYERVRDEILDALGAWLLPGGAPVIERAWRREEIHAGPHCNRAPDIVLELALDAGYGLSLVPTPWSEPGAASVRTLDPRELAGGRGRGMNGTHRPDGIWIATGPGALGLEANGIATLADAGPTLLRAMGIPWDGEMDGSPMSPVSVPYTPEEEERVAQRLRALGYLE